MLFCRTMFCGGPCHHNMACPRDADIGDGVQLWGVAANTLNKYRGQPRRGGPPAWGLDQGLTTAHRKKNQLITKCHTGSQNWTYSSERSSSGSGYGPGGGGVL